MVQNEQSIVETRTNDKSQNQTG